MKHPSRRIRAHVAACLLAGCVFASTAQAAVVYSGPVNISVPASIDGIYFNVVTGASGPTGAAAPGWDINPYSGGSPPGNFLNLFGNLAGGTYLSTGGVIAGPFRLAQGTQIGSAGTFFNPNGNTNIVAELNVGSDDNLFGFRFANEGNMSQVHFGWFRLRIGENTGVRTIIGYAYDDVAGTAVLAGDPRVFSDSFESALTP